MGTRVLVIDDTVVFRRVISEALAALPGIEIVGTAPNGKIGLSRIETLKPDLVTLDIEMPEMDGIEVLQVLRGSEYKPGIVVLSSLTARGGDTTMRALELGAFDFVTKPQEGVPDANLGYLRSRLAPIVRAFEARRGIQTILRGGNAPVAGARTESILAHAAPPQRPVRTGRSSAQPIVLVGVSTGGPVALAKVLPELPRDLDAPVFIVQHMPALFTQSLAASLAAKCAIPVTEAKDGEIAALNRIYIAPGGRHMKLAAGPHGDIVVRITDDPPENNCRPSVDYLFRSAALQFPGRSIAAVLTGMGNDGAAGLRMLKRGGCASIAQDEASCVVFGMPREAILAGVVDIVAPLDEIAGTIVRKVREARA